MKAAIERLKRLERDLQMGLNPRYCENEIHEIIESLTQLEINIKDK